MASYLNPTEIRFSLKALVKDYIEECEKCHQIPEDFIDLIKHNFLAKYVFYNPKKKHIEIGIEDPDAEDHYPEIKTYKIPVKQAAEWLDKSFKKNECDLQFYGRLLNRNEILNPSDIVLMK
ncbi:MAG: hypothetical protein WBV11_05860 [Salegentibacter sp.]